MSLEYIVLGFLEIGPKTGYDIKRLFDRSISGFWSADKSRIYRTLDKLRERGWASREVVRQEDRPDKKLHTITEEGREAFHRWMEEHPMGPPLRNAFLVQLFFAGLVSDDEAIRILEAKRRRILDALASYPELYRMGEPYEHDEPERVDFFHWLTLDSAIWLDYAHIEWVDTAIDRIRRKDYAKGRDGAITRWPPYEDPRTE